MTCDAVPVFLQSVSSRPVHSAHFAEWSFTASIQLFCFAFVSRISLATTFNAMLICFVSVWNAFVATCATGAMRSLSIAVSVLSYLWVWRAAVLWLTAAKQAHVSPFQQRLLMRLQVLTIFLWLSHVSVWLVSVLDWCAPESETKLHIVFDVVGKLSVSAALFVTHVASPSEHDNEPISAPSFLDRLTAVSDLVLAEKKSRVFECQQVRAFDKRLVVKPLLAC